MSTIAAPRPPRAPAAAPARAQRTRLRLSPWHGALAGVVALSALLNFNHLAQNGYANVFYSAGVKSELSSWHNFLFVSFDPHGFISIDKPPIGLWVQVLSAKLFGLHPLSLLAPEALAGVCSVIVLYRIVAPRCGRPAGVASALALAVFPSFVAVSRDNGPDAVLILLMLCACAVGLAAVRSGRWRSVIGCALLVGLAFNTKTLAALLIVPGIVLAYLVGAPVPTRRRLLQLLAAGVVLVIVSGSWIAFVDLTPASQRPYVGSSADNREFNLTFDYNGLGRVNGQEGGPGNVPLVNVSSLPPVPPATAASLLRHLDLTVYQTERAVQLATASAAARLPTIRPTAGQLRAQLAALQRDRALQLGRARVAAQRAAARRRFLAQRAALPPGVEPIPTVGRASEPSVFGGPTGLGRLFSLSLGGQDAWYLPFALVGLIAIALTRPRRRDPMLATLIVLGGWFLCEALLLSFSKGIVHPYYVSALAPGAAAMTGIGATVLARRARQLDWRAALIALAGAATVAVQLMLLGREHYLQAFVPVLVVGSVVAIAVAVLRSRLAGPAVAVLLGLCLVAPTAYASTLWLVPTDGTFPAAGPHVAKGLGGVGASPSTLAADRHLIAYVDARAPGIRWGVLTIASDTSAPLILLNVPATALAGYSGTDQALSARGLAGWVARGQARYVLLGGAYSTRGGNGATRAARVACQFVPSAQWRGRGAGGGDQGLALYDCRGRAARLAAAG